MRIPPGLRVVQADQLGRLGRRRRHDPIGIRDDGFFPRQAGVGLGLLAAREGVVLHLAERVERGDERHPPDLLRGAPDPPRQPVVGVDEVVAMPLEALSSKDAAQELREESRELLLRNGHAWPRFHLDDPRTRRRSPPPRARLCPRQRVNTSMSKPKAPSRAAASRMYTFIPPESPLPGWSAGDVWRLTTAIRGRTPPAPEAPFPLPLTHPMLSDARDRT